MTNGMNLRKLGGSDIEASAIGLGTWAMGGWMWGGTDEAAAVDAIRASIDHGVTLIDTAVVPVAEPVADVTTVGVFWVTAAIAMCTHLRACSQTSREYAD